MDSKHLDCGRSRNLADSSRVFFKGPLYEKPTSSPLRLFSPTSASNQRLANHNEVGRSNVMFIAYLQIIDLEVVNCAIMTGTTSPSRASDIGETAALIILGLRVCFLSLLYLFVLLSTHSAWSDRWDPLNAFLGPQGHKLGCECNLKWERWTKLLLFISGVMNKTTQDQNSRSKNLEKNDEGCFFFTLFNMMLSTFSPDTEYVDVQSCQQN